MANSIRARSYLLTGNNPEKLIKELEINYETAKEEDYRNGLKTLIEIWTRGDKNHEGRRPELNGCMAAWERGEKEKTSHVHIWICSKNAIELEAVKSRFPKFHVDVVSAQEAADVENYLSKAGKHKGKGVQLCEPVKWGEHFCTNREARAKLYEDLEKYVKLGMKPRQIILEDPRFAMHEQMVQAYYGAFAQKLIPPIRQVRVVYRTGEVGAGKSFTYVKLCAEHGEENVYLVSGASTMRGCFDEYASEKILVIDELRSDTFRWQELLTLLDGYKRQVAARYKNRMAAWSEVHLCSVISPETLYKGVKHDGKEDAFEQLKRRINEVVYHYKDMRFEGEAMYRTVSVKGADYVGIEQLRQMAEQAKCESRLE